MLSPSLPAACYTDDAWYEREKKLIFGRLWLLAGLRQQLAEKNSFITRNFCGTPVLVQNVGGGQLKAFLNVCAHRGMPLQSEAFGIRNLVCPYHGWAYNADGSLRGIPVANVYNICDAERDKLGLKSFAIETVGAFVFINLADNPLPLSEQYSSNTLSLLAGASKYFAPEVSYATFESSYNWKLNFENILDWNHAQFVHRNTLAPMLAFDEGRFAAPPTESRLFGQDSPLRNLFSEDANASGEIRLQDISHIGRSGMPFKPRWYSGLFEAPCDVGAFFACNLFPNVNFGSIHGENFYVQQYAPLGPDRIQYHSWIFTTHLKPDVPPQPQLLWGIHHGEKRVIDEDTVLLEALQKSLKSVQSTGVMGDHEAPLVAMGLWYMKHMKAGA